MWIATIVGKVDDDLAAIEPGPSWVSTWNTLWSRVLRVYVATAQPSNQLQRITNMIVSYQETFVHDRWSAQHFCMLAVAETSEQHGDKHCEGGGAKKCLFCSSRPTPACYVYR